MQKKLSLLSFKKLLFSSTIATLVILPASLSVAACRLSNSKEENASKKYSNQDIIDAINKVDTYEIPALSYSEVKEIKKSVSAKFIKNELSNPIKSYFDESLFKLVKITKESGVQLSDEDLITPSRLSLKCKIVYTYQDSEEQTTNLKINIVKRNVPLNEEILDAINKVDTYEITVLSGSKIKEIKKNVSAKFIKNKLSNWIKFYFDDSLFNLVKITDESGVELSDEDLRSTGSIDVLDEEDTISYEVVINAKIVYSYQDSEVQTTNLKINIVKG